MVLSAIETIVAGIVLPGLKFVSNKKASNQELCYEELGRGEDSHFYIIVPVHAQNGERGWRTLVIIIKTQS